MQENNLKEGLYNRFLGDETVKRLGMDPPLYMCHRNQADVGIFFGYIFSGDGPIYIGKPQDEDGHAIIVGGSGSGKSSCIVIPTLREWEGTFFAIDVKGDLLENVLPHMKSKYPTKVFEFTKNQDAEPKRCTYDPFDYLRKDDPDNLVQNAREIAQAIAPTPPQDSNEFWSNSAQNVLTGDLLYVNGLKETDENGEVLEGTFNDAMELIQSKPMYELIKDINKSGNSNAIKHIKQYTGIEVPEDNKMIAGINAELSNSAMVFATDNRVMASFTKSDYMFSCEDLEDHNVIMVVPEDKLDQWSRAITLVITQVIRSLERRPEKHSKGYNLPPVLLMLDEFPRLGKMDVLINAISTLRSKGVTVCLAVQSIAQLDRIYGRDCRRIIVDNCQYKAILNITDPENQKYFSDMIGSINVSVKSVSETVSNSSGESNGSSHSSYLSSNGKQSYSDGKSQSTSSSLTVTTSLVREPIIFPHEMATLKDILMLTPEGFCRVNKLPYYQQLNHPNLTTQDTWCQAMLKASLPYRNAKVILYPICHKIKSFFTGKNNQTQSNNICMQGLIISNQWSKSK